MSRSRERNDNPSRRRLLATGVGLASAYAGLRYGLPTLSERLHGLRFEPLDQPAGFRRLISNGGTSSGSFDPFIALAPTADRVRPSCRGLFEDAAPPGIVPAAYFSDYNCAYCRALGPRLEALQGVHVTLHELPLLGEGSTILARAALAANLQEAYWPFHQALMSTPRPSPEAIIPVALDLGLDPDRLRADMDAPEVAAALARSEALAALFGIYATPALVIGRTLVIGAVAAVTLDRLTDRELADGPVPTCA